MRRKAVTGMFVVALAAAGATASGEQDPISRREHASSFRGDDISGPPRAISGDGSTVAIGRATDPSGVSILGPVRTDWDLAPSDVVLSPTGRFAVTREPALDGRFERIDRRTGVRVRFGASIPAGRRVAAIDEAGDRVALDDGPRDRTSTVVWSIADDTTLTPSALAGPSAPPTRTRSLSPAGDRLVVAEYRPTNSLEVVRFTEHDLGTGATRSIDRPAAHQIAIDDWSVSSNLRWVFSSTYADDGTTAIRHLEDLATGASFTESIQGDVDGIVVTDSGAVVFRRIVGVGASGRDADILMWHPARAPGLSSLPIGTVVGASDDTAPFVVSADGSTAAWTEVRRRFDGTTPSTGSAVVVARIDGSEFPSTPVVGPATVNAPAVRLSLEPAV